MTDTLEQLEQAVPWENPLGLRTERAGAQQFWVGTTTDPTVTTDVSAKMLIAFAEGPTASYPVSAMFGLRSTQGSIAVEYLQTADYPRLEGYIEEARRDGEQDLQGQLRAVLTRGYRDCDRFVRCLMSMLPSEHGWTDEFPGVLEGTGLGSALMELLSSFMPLGARLVFRIAHEKSVQELKAGVPLCETTMLRRWRRVGFELQEARDTDPFDQPAVVLAKTTCPEVLATWSDPDRVGPYVLVPREPVGR